MTTDDPHQKHLEAISNQLSRALEEAPPWTELAIEEAHSTIKDARKDHVQMLEMDNE